MSKQQNKKILYLLSGNEPSAFVRAKVYQEEYRKRGYKADYIQLKSNFLLRLMKKAKPLLLLKLLFELLVKLNFLIKQYFLLKHVADYDVIIAIKFVKSKLLGQIKAKSQAMLIFDFDDSIWLKGFDGEDEFSRKISIVDYVTSDNSYLANYASKYNKNSFIVNGPCQIEKFIHYKNSEKPNIKLENKVILGWVGSPHTLFYLYHIYEALELIGQKYPNVVLKLIGTGKDRVLIPPFEKIKVETIPFYDQKEMIRQVHSLDIGLYPLFLNELSLGRGSLKATIYMSGSVPSVCSGFGENNRIIENGKNGFLANNTEEWIEKLSCLIENPELRNTVGENGFQYAKGNYSIESCFNQLMHVINFSNDPN
jgi:glycosyltransferase involved in cell wall biosynthesis